jgi:hypothetical protein
MDMGSLQASLAPRPPNETSLCILQCGVLVHPPLLPSQLYRLLCCRPLPALDHLCPPCFTSRNGQLLNRKDTCFFNCGAGVWPARRRAPRLSPAHPKRREASRAHQGQVSKIHCCHWWSTTNRHLAVYVCSACRYCSIPPRLRATILIMPCYEQYTPQRSRARLSEV